MSRDGVVDGLVAARERLAADDVAGAMRHLRFAAETADLAELAGVVRQAAAMVGFDDLVAAATAVSAAPRDPQALYDFGYASIEHGAGYLAVPALAAGVREAPGEPGMLTELVMAYEMENRHADAVRVLEERESTLRPWPDRYLLAFNSIMSGDLDRAAGYFARLPEPGDDWAPARDRLGNMLARADAVRPVSPLDRRDLRGWHFVLNAGVLGTVSPYGFDAMTGRWAYVQDTKELCRRGLERFRLALDAAGLRPTTVSLLSDRSSRILGLAAAQVLGLPAEPWSPGRTDTVVVAYDLREAGEDLRQRPPGQVLVEHATCWTDPPGLAADFSTLLHQVVVPPWAQRRRITPDGEPAVDPPDERPAEAVAGEIAAAEAAPDDGDGDSPPDPDERFAAFATEVRVAWPARSAARGRMWSPGPVPSNRFI